MSTERDKMTEK